MNRWCALALVPLAVACGSNASDGALDEGGSGGGMNMGGGGGLSGGPPISGSGGSGLTGSEAAALEPNLASKSGGAQNAPGCPGFTGSTQLDLTVADARGMASGPRVREQVATGQAGPAAVRTSEVNNYYRLSWPNTPEPGGFLSRVGVRPRKVGATVLPGHYDLLVALRADPNVHLRQRVEMVVVVDTSTWMTEEGLARGRKVVRALANSMLPGDYFALKSLAGTVLFESVLLAPSAELADVEAKLVREDGGSVRSSVEGALAKLQETPAEPAVWKRVVFVGNGATDDGPDPDIIQKAATSAHQVFVSAVGVGQDGYNGGMLAGLARAGRGAHLYIDNLDEPEKLIEARFVEIFGMAADDVRFAISLPWFMQSLDPLPPPDSSASAPPQYLSPGGTMLHVFRLFVCETALTAATNDVIGISVDFRLPGETTSQSLPLVMKPVAKALLQPVPELDELEAIDAWVSAFRSPNSTRYALAKQLLDSTDLQGKAPFSDLLTILDKHPNAPNN